MKNRSFFFFFFPFQQQIPSLFPSQLPPPDFWKEAESPFPLKATRFFYASILFAFTSAMASSMSRSLSSRRVGNGSSASSSRRAASATAPRAAAEAAAASRNVGDSSSLPSTSGRVGRDRRSSPPSLRLVRARSSNSAAAARRSRSPSPQSTRHDVVGLGQAMVDFSAAVDDAFLAEFGVAKGGRR